MPEKRFDLQALFDGGDFPVTDLGVDSSSQGNFS